MRFLEGIGETRKAELLKQLRAVWTHDSTAIEGNTLTLGETMFVLGYGLTVKGKSLKDQAEVQNHARAIDAVLELVGHAEATEEELVDAYARTHVGFTSIHPFYDGNGRLARILANLPVLFAGFPPIVIPVESREDYLKALREYERGHSDLSAFRGLVRESWKTTLDLVAEARAGK